MADLLHLEAGLRAVEAGCDAVFINSVLDYGVRLLRAETPVPVVGAGEAAIAVSALVAKTFAIVTVWPEITRSSYEHLLAKEQRERPLRVYPARHEKGKGHRRARRGAALKEMILAQSNDIVGRIVAECRSAVEADGAEVVILGCTCMAPSVALVQAALTCPVIDPMTAGYRAAESAAALKLRRRPLIVAPDGRMLSSARVAAMLSALAASRFRPTHRVPSVSPDSSAAADRVSATKLTPSNEDSQSPDTDHLGVYDPAGLPASYPFDERLREQSACEFSGVGYLVSRFEDVLAVLRDLNTFSSAYNTGFATSRLRVNRGLPPSTP